MTATLEEFAARMSTIDFAKELARRLRSGSVDQATLDTAAFTLESFAALYTRSQALVAKAFEVIDGLRRGQNERRK